MFAEERLLESLWDSTVGRRFESSKGFYFQGHIHGVTTFLPARPKPEEVLYIGLTDARILCMLSRALRGSADGH